MLLILLSFIMVGNWNYEQVKISFLSVKNTIKNELEGEAATVINW